MTDECTFLVMRTTSQVALILVAFASATFAQDSTETSPVEAAILANDRAYEEAYAKGDAKTLADFFTEDAEYTAEDGRTIRGRAEIEGAIRAALAERKGGNLAINMESVRMLAPGVLLEKGTTTVTPTDGDVSESLYTAIYVKKDGEWKISQLIESPMSATTPHERLAELAWLIGKWEETDEANDLTVDSDYLWARGGNFITRNVTVKRGGETTLEGWQIIGWDPIEGRIRSWTFDGEGGFAEAWWTREGERWLLRETGVTPDGSRTGAENTITKLGPDRFAWESDNRTVDSEPQPNIGSIEINRVKGE
jgi:uncharacterized protein (TIGR02246 family)